MATTKATKKKKTVKKKKPQEPIYHLQGLTKRQRVQFKNYLTGHGHQDAADVLFFIKSGMSFVQAIQSVKRLRDKEV